MGIGIEAEMKTRYKHIHFKEFREPFIEGRCFMIVNNKTEASLGTIYFYPQWKKYVFEGFEGCCFDVNCLNDIIDFINQL